MGTGQLTQAQSGRRVGSGVPVSPAGIRVASLGCRVSISALYPVSFPPAHALLQWGVSDASSLGEIIRNRGNRVAEFEIPDDFRNDTRTAWKRYVDVLAPFRPDLHRYCLGLTRNLWDAEDLVQETVIRGFGTLNSLHGRIENPRGYLVRIATNLWIDLLRRRSAEAAALKAEPPVPAQAAATSQRAETRAAGARLMERLSPQERAAVLMKDVFDMSLDDIANALGTTLGAVKSALHRGRARLDEPDASPQWRRPKPSIALVDRFVELLNGSDLPGACST